MQIPTLLEYLQPSLIVGGSPVVAWVCWKASERLTRLEGNHETLNTKFDERTRAIESKVDNVQTTISELRADIREDRKGGF